MKAQIGIEYLVIVAFSLIVVSFLWVLSSTNVEDTRWELQIAYAKSALNKITEAADIVYVQGEPARFYVYPTFPDNLQKVYISNSTITFELRWKGILRNISRETIGVISGSLSTASGTHRVLVRAVNSTVEIIEA